MENTTPFIQTIIDNAHKYEQRQAYRVFRDQAWQSVSWTKFLENISRVASSLMAEKLQPGDLVALYAPNCPEWTEIDYGCMAAKVVTVAIHATSSVNAVTQMVNQTTPKIIFVGNSELAEVVLNHTQARNLVVLEGSHPQCRTLAEFLDVELNPHWDDLVACTKAEDLWTIVYTSGTTGDVRGAMLTHGNIVHQISQHLSRLPDLTSKDSSFCLLPLSHIFERGWSAIQYSWGLTHHYCHVTPAAMQLVKSAAPAVICVVPRILEKVYAAIQENFAQKSASMRSIVQKCISAALLFEELRLQGQPVSPWLRLKHKLAEVLVLKKVRAVFGGHLKHLVVGSAALSKEVHEFFRACGIFINSGYGLTETTATISSTPIGKSIPMTVGLPMDKITIRLGERDEIQVKGPIVMQGYYKNPEVTAEVFTEDGFFRTGDVGAYSPEGYLCITDRLKDLIRTSTGKYVAPQYLESRLSGSPLIEQAAIIGEGRSWLGALIVPNFALLEEYAKSIDLQYASRQELVNNQQIIDYVLSKLDTLMSDVGRHEKIQRIALLEQPFTIQSDELTPTLKLRRKVIAEHYHEVIAAMDYWYNHRSDPNLAPAT